MTTLTNTANKTLKPPTNTVIASWSDGKGHWVQVLKPAFTSHFFYTGENKNKNLKIGGTLSAKTEAEAILETRLGPVKKMVGEGVVLYRTK